MKYGKEDYINNIALIDNTDIIDFLCGLYLHEKGSTFWYKQYKRNMRCDEKNLRK